MENTIVQKLIGKALDEFSLAKKYYAILFSLNDIEITNRELQLVSFTGIKGNISNANVRDEFCKKFKTSSPTINNMISKLKKKGIFIKEDGKIKVNPRIVLDFKKNIVLQISLNHE
jgi:hypothetical protein